MLDSNNVYKDESKTHEASESPEMETKERSLISVYADRFQDFHHRGQDIENVVILSIN